jgi:hypothetical protein
MTTMPDNPEDTSRRRFNATLAAGGAYAAVHHVLGAAADAAPRAAEAAEARQASRPPNQELCDMTAVELAARLARKQVSAREVMTAHLARIERVNPKINAIVTLVAEQAMANAAKADEAIARGGPRACCTGCR